MAMSNRATFTFAERCTDDPDHFSVEIEARNQNPNAVLSPDAPRYVCPVCSAHTEVDMEPLKQCDGCGERWTFISEDRLTDGLYLCGECMDLTERGEDVPLADVYSGDADP